MSPILSLRAHLAFSREHSTAGSNPDGRQNQKFLDHRDMHVITAPDLDKHYALPRSFPALPLVA